MESPPPIPRYIPQKSKKRVFPGSRDPDVFGTSPPLRWTRSSTSNWLEQKEVVQHEVIDIEMDEDSEDVMLTEKFDTRNKGKALANFPCPSMPGSMDGVQSPEKSSAPWPHNSFNLEGLSHDFSSGDEEYMDMNHDDLTYDDKYAFLQAHFDSMDIPPGVEAPVPWFSEPEQNKKIPAAVTGSKPSSFPIQCHPPGTDSLHSWGLPELAQTGNKSIAKDNSVLQTQLGTPSHPYGVDLSPSWSFPESSPNEKSSAASTSSIHLSSHTERALMNPSYGMKSWHMPGFPHNKKKHAVNGSGTNYTSHSQPDTMNLSSGMDASVKGYYLRNMKKLVANDSLTYSSSSAKDMMNFAPGVNANMFGLHGSPTFMNQPFLTSDVSFNPFDALSFFPEKELNIDWVQDIANSHVSATAAASSTAPFGPTSCIEKHINEKDVMEKFQTFKQFDTVQDHSDHHYSCKGSSVKQQSKDWVKKIQEEWRILENDLPDTIFVRVYESRMDLLRAVIVGADGTPYHDGLFFFDVFFPCGYPNIPPHVYYHSGGLRINPNLYGCGKVCLSLLNTWSGSQNEMWIPGVSTMLQVLVSIQALILNEKPYFNEPGCASMSGSAEGEKLSQRYSETSFVLSLKTMVYTIRRPPKHFEDFVYGHFLKRAQDILVACEAYMGGAKVGCLAKGGGVQDVGAGDKSCPQYFKSPLAGCITMLVQTFSQIGAKDCEKFLPLAEKVNNSQEVSSVPMASKVYWS